MQLSEHVPTEFVQANPERKSYAPAPLIFAVEL